MSVHIRTLHPKFCGIPGCKHPGDVFRAVWDGGKYTKWKKGRLLRLSAGSASVRVEIPIEEDVKFHRPSDDKDFEFVAGHKILKTEWSLGTLVEKLDQHEGGEEQWFPPEPQQGDEVMAEVSKSKTGVSLKPKDATKETGGNGAAKAAAAPKEAKAPREKKEVVLSPCGCGCGEQVARRFKMGHDSKFYSGLRKVDKGEMKFNELPGIVQKTVKDKAGVRSALVEHFGDKYKIPAQPEA